MKQMNNRIDMTWSVIIIFFLCWHSCGVHLKFIGLHTYIPGLVLLYIWFYNTIRAVNFFNQFFWAPSHPLLFLLREHGSLLLWSMGFTQLEGTSICPFQVTWSMGSCQRKDRPSVHSIDLDFHAVLSMHHIYIVVLCIYDVIRKSRN